MSAVVHRREPLFHALIGPGYEQSSLLAVPTEAAASPTTRFQADRDTVVLPDQLGFPLDPTQQPEYSPALTARGRTCKAVFDCTVPLAQRSRFARATFGA